MRDTARLVASHCSFRLKGGVYVPAPSLLSWTTG
jgi:hypothetical protein